MARLHKLDLRRRIDRAARNIAAGYTFGTQAFDRVMPYLRRRSAVSRQNPTPPPSRRGRGRGYQSGRSLYRKPQVELKAFDQSSFTNGLRTPAAGTSISPIINLPINGPELYQRVGRKIYMKSVQVTGYVYNVATAPQSLGRILLMYDSQSNGALPVVADILSDMTAVIATSGCSHLNLNNRQRFQVLRDHKITLPAVTNTVGVLTNGPAFNDTAPFRYEINWFIKLKGLEAVYNQVNGGTIADVASGALFLLFVTDAGDATWTFKGCTRLRYYD